VSENLTVVYASLVTEPFIRTDTRGSSLSARRNRSPLRGRIHLRRLLLRSTSKPLQSGGGPYIHSAPSQWARSPSMRRPVGVRSFPPQCPPTSSQEYSVAPLELTIPDASGSADFELHGTIPLA